MNIEELAVKHKDDFPGYQLVDYYEAAFPVYMLQLAILMERQRSIPLMEEFILKSIEAGQETVADIADLLGLEWDVVRVSLGNLQQGGYVSLSMHKENKNSMRIALTSKGHHALMEMMFRQPEPDSLAVCMDALTGLLYPSRPLRQARDIREFEFHEIPTFLSMPQRDALNFEVLKRIVRGLQAPQDRLAERRELLDVLELEKYWTGYRVMRVLQFVRYSDGEIQVEVFDASERSSAHEGVLLRMENQRYRPLRAFMKEEVPSVVADERSIFEPETVAAARRNAAESPKLQGEIDIKTARLEQAKTKQDSRVVAERQEANHEIEQLTQQLSDLQARLQEMEKAAGNTQVLQMHEHRPKLIEALQLAQSQIIIVSPWLNEQAVDYELCQQIAKTLERGIDICIGYGFGDSNYYEEQARKKLDKIAQGKRGQLYLYRIGDVHSKVLICDKAFMIITSFNWFSFKGDPKRGSRVEDGILTRDINAIAIKTEEWLNRFAEVAQAV